MAKPGSRSFDYAFKRFSMYEHSTNFWESKGCAGTSELGKDPKGAMGWVDCDNVYLERLQLCHGSSSGVSHLTRTTMTTYKDFWPIRE